MRMIIPLFLIAMIGFAPALAQTNTLNAASCDSTVFNYPKIILDKFPLDVDAGQTITFTGRLFCENGYKQSNVLINIIEDDVIDKEVLVTGHTDQNGEFSIPWKAKAQMFEEMLTIRAKYVAKPIDPSYDEYAPESDKRFLTVHRQMASISLDPLPQSAEIGQIIFFTGTLNLQAVNPEGYVVYIKDEDSFSSDDLLATGYVNSDGKFSANWIVTNVDDDKIADIYAVFEGADIYYRVTTCDYGITHSQGGACDRTIPLKITGEIPPPQPTDSDGDGISDIMDKCPNQPETYNGYQDEDGCPDSQPPPTDTDGDGIYDRSDACVSSAENYNNYQDSDGCPDTPPPITTDSDNDGIDDFYDQCKNSPETYNGYQDTDGCPDTLPLRPSTKEILNGNEYMELYYSHSFEKNPLVGIIPDPDSYDKVKVYSITAQEGIRIWESELQKKFGGKWNVDFEIMPKSQDKFNKKPDIIMQLVTRETVAGCGKVFGGYARVPFFSQKPVGIVVCTAEGNYFYSSDQVAHTSAHEFIHAMGLGHAFNKVGDLMCSVDLLSGKPTCGNQRYASQTSKPSDFNLAAVGKLYGKDGFINPNSNILYGTKFTTTDYVNDDYSITNKDEPLKPQVTKDSDLDGILDDKDQCIYQKETLNGYKDSDGCPDTKPITTDTWKTKTLKLQTDVNKKIDSLKIEIDKAKNSVDATKFKNPQAKKELDKASKKLWWAKKYLIDAGKAQKKGEELISKLEFQDAYYKYQYSMVSVEKVNKNLLDITKYINNGKKLEK